MCSQGRAPADPAADDSILRAAVLRLVLIEYPVMLTTADLERELTGPTAGATRTDAIERAVRDLVGAGLVNRADALVIPSRAAVEFDRLDVD